MTREDTQTVAELQSRGAELLREAGMESPSLDARLLLAEAMAVDASKLVGLGKEDVPPEQTAIFEELIARRAGGEPVHRIAGRRDFFGRTFSFGKDSLVPRPETELLVERILKDHKPMSEARFAEIGVGSGVIIVTLLAERANMLGSGADIADGALADTLENARSFGVADRISLVKSDCLENLEGPFDFIVSNPPYIATSELSDLAREVRNHDPQAALNGGVDGLRIYEKLLSQGRNHLRQGGRMYLETGHGQHRAIGEMAAQMGWGYHSAHLDLSGLERIVVLQAD